MAEYPSQRKTTLIRVKFSTKGRLDIVGNKGDSYDDILNRILDYFLEHNKDSGGSARHG